MGTLARIRRYSLAVLSVAAALGASLWIKTAGMRSGEMPPFLFALALSAWFGGPGPAILALFLSCAVFDYFFIEPVHSFMMSRQEAPYLVVFASFAVLVTWFSNSRKRVEDDLREARERLELELAQRRRREEEIRSLNQELSKRSLALETSNKELEAFAYSVSHDLRAPLRHMSGFSELLQKNAAASLNDKGKRYLLMILESAKRMGNLIDDLLAFSRIGRAERRQTLVSLDQIVREAVTEVRTQAAGRDIAWTIGDLPSVYGDRSMLRLVLVNLVSNAVKFTRTRPNASVQIGCLEKRGDQAVVFVRDNGVGFDMRYIDKLFGVFQRLHGPEEFEGTGIGLATVQRIVHRHGGNVWAEGMVNEGATFYFSLAAVEGDGH
ncbi:MAG TPA: ATP-binding protein [Bryobacteraceae bacterium]|nr:ATP-binding protein [Bryobacteraceae bacterium]